MEVGSRQLNRIRRRLEESFSLRDELTCGGDPAADSAVGRRLGLQIRSPTDWAAARGS